MIAEAMRLTPDVMVADILMPALSGIEAAHELREIGSTAELVFLTIHAEQEFVDACLEEGAVGYVVKSHIKTDLIPAIQAALAGRSFISSSSQPRGLGFPSCRPSWVAVQKPLVE